MERSGTRQRGCSHNCANVPNTTEGHTLKWLTLYSMNFTSIKKNDYVNWGNGLATRTHSEAQPGFQNPCARLRERPGEPAGRDPTGRAQSLPGKERSEGLLCWGLVCSPRALLHPTCLIPGMRAHGFSALNTDAIVNIERDQMRRIVSRFLSDVRFFLLGVWPDGKTTGTQLVPRPPPPTPRHGFPLGDQVFTTSRRREPGADTPTPQQREIEVPGRASFPSSR